MKNGITINGTQYKAVRHLIGCVIASGCDECDLLQKCDRRLAPCLLFDKANSWVNFKRILKAKRRNKYMYHFDNGHIYDCSKCRHVALTPGCIFSKDYRPSENNYPCDANGNPLKPARKED